MMSKELSIESGKRIVVRPVRSRILITLVSSLHALAITLLFFTGLDTGLLIVIAGLVLVNLRRSSIFSSSCNHCLSFQLGGSLLLQTHDSKWHETDMLESFVTNWLIVIRVRSLKNLCQHSLVYSADSMSSCSFRHLRIYLNHFRAASQPS